MSTLHPAVFFDRDGTLIQDKHFLKDPEEMEWVPGVQEGLRALQDAGWLLFIVTNQSGVGRGYFTLDDVHAIHERMIADLKPFGVGFTEIYYAPEAPEEPSRGRKPSPQFLYDARDAFHVDLARSIMVGDKLSDLECGWNAGTGRVCLVRTGKGAEAESELPQAPVGPLEIHEDVTALIRTLLKNSP